MPFVGCAGVGVSVFFAVLWLRLEALDRFLLLVAMYGVPGIRHCIAGKVSLRRAQYAAQVGAEHLKCIG